MPEKWAKREITSTRGQVPPYIWSHSFLFRVILHCQLQIIFPFSIDLLTKVLCWMTINFSFTGKKCFDFLCG